MNADEAREQRRRMSERLLERIAACPSYPDSPELVEDQLRTAEALMAWQIEAMSAEEE